MASEGLFLLILVIFTLGQVHSHDVVITYLDFCQLDVLLKYKQSQGDFLVPSNYPDDPTLSK